MLKIAITQENKQPADKRAPLTPSNCALLLTKYPNKIEIWVESCNERIFKDEEYIAVGCKIIEDLSTCDIILGVKEVPIDFLWPSKTFLFFSHTIKKQPSNQAMFQSMIKKHITLIDYEKLVENDKRILGFGYHAGIVGAYNGLLTYGKKTGLFNLKPAYLHHDYTDLVKTLQSVEFPAMQIALTGGGRVANGAVQLLHDAGMEPVDKEQYLTKKGKAQFVHLKSEDIYFRKDGSAYDRVHFHQNHKQYKIDFEPYYENTDVMINGIFWEQDMPIFFDKEDTAKPNFNIKVIADISCDVDGSIPITYQATSIANPVIGWDKVNLIPCEPYTKNSIDIMAVSNLPCELPKDASELFGHDLATKVFPEFFKAKSAILKGATILKDGILTEKYNYLEQYATGDLIKHK